MNKLSQLLNSNKQDLLSLFFTAGHPGQDSVLKLLPAMETAGVDFAEVGFPFSDPLADGPVIQRSSQIALDGGMTLKKLFKQLEEIGGGLQMPYLLMGYINPFMQYGPENFCNAASAVGASGVIIPDISPEMFKARYKGMFDKHDLHFIHLITPETSEERIRLIDELSTAFIYAVASSSTTGGKQAGQGTTEYLLRLEKMNLHSPVIAGFGIRNAENFKGVCRHARGGIIGSAFVEKLKLNDNYGTIVREIVNDIRKD